MFDPITEFKEACDYVEKQLKTKVMTEEEITSLRSKNFYIFKAPYELNR